MIWKSTAGVTDVVAGSYQPVSFFKSHILLYKTAASTLRSTVSGFLLLSVPLMQLIKSSGDFQSTVRPVTNPRSTQLTIIVQEATSTAS
jgi:hypothetical protein